MQLRLVAAGTETPCQTGRRTAGVTGGWDRWKGAAGTTGDGEERGRHGHEGRGRGQDGVVTEREMGKDGDRDGDGTGYGTGRTRRTDDNNPPCM